MVEKGYHMTWDEFKTIVDAELSKVGKDGSIQIGYIDTGNYPTAKRLDVFVGTEDILIVS